jgi:integrase/recombinase XerD
MRHLQLQVVEHRRLHLAFKQWLESLSYAPTTVYNAPNYLKEYLHYLELHNLKVSKVKAQNNRDYIEYLKERENTRRSGGLSIGHINKAIDTLYKFDRYLGLTSNKTIHCKLNYLKEAIDPKRNYLTKEQIELLYSITNTTPLGQRDKAMLGIYYGCGLRKSEGIALELTDINFDKKILVVRKSKTGRERYVPIPSKVLGDLESYIYEGRKMQQSKKMQTSKLLLTERGKTMSKEAVYKRFIELKDIANITIPGGLHLLRHSIATHLLQAGMELEKIALFLGHQSLDSTQIYAQLKEKEP